MLTFAEMPLFRRKDGRDISSDAPDPTGAQVPESVPQSETDLAIESKPRFGRFVFPAVAEFLVLSGLVGATLFAGWNGLYRAGTPSAREVADASEAAEEACRHMERMERLIVEDAETDKVLDELEAADRLSDRAAAKDPVWVSLAGGIDTVRLSLEHDDVGAARIGIGVVRSTCREPDE